MTKLIAVAAIIAATCTACPQKPNPYCPNNVCSKAPTSTR